MLKKVLFFIYNIQNNFLKFKLDKTINYKQTSKSKKFYSKGCFVCIDCVAKEERLQLEEELFNILKKYEFNPDLLLSFLQNQNVLVIKNTYKSKFLKFINEKEGFILPQTGLNALFLSFCLNKKIALKTQPMFLLSEGEINKFFFIYHFYNWFMFKNGIEGIDASAYSLLNKYLSDDADTKELQLAEIIKIKDAIKQDKAAIDFVLNICQRIETLKNAHEKLVNDNSINL